MGNLRLNIISKRDIKSAGGEIIEIKRDKT